MRVEKVAESVCDSAFVATVHTWVSRNQFISSTGSDVGISSICLLSLVASKTAMTPASTQIGGIKRSCKSRHIITYHHNVETVHQNDPHRQQWMCGHLFAWRKQAKYRCRLQTRVMIKFSISHPRIGECVLKWQNAKVAVRDAQDTNSKMQLELNKIALKSL